MQAVISTWLELPYTYLAYSKMRRLLFIIAFLFIASAINAQKNKSVVECLEILFSKERFDTEFYSRKPHEEITCFFVLKDSIVDKFLNVPDFEYTPYKLRNGNQFSIQPRNYLFVWGIDYFVRFMGHSLTDEKIILVFQEINNNGFKEKVLKTREFVFEKKEVWRLTKESNW